MRRCLDEINTICPWRHPILANVCTKNSVNLQQAPKWSILRQSRKCVRHNILSVLVIGNEKEQKAVKPAFKRWYNSRPDFFDYHINCVGDAIGTTVDLLGVEQIKRLVVNCSHYFNIDIDKNRVVAAAFWSLALNVQNNNTSSNEAVHVMAKLTNIGVGHKSVPATVHFFDDRGPVFSTLINLIAQLGYKRPGWFTAKLYNQLCNSNYYRAVLANEKRNNLNKCFANALDAKDKITIDL